MESDTSQVSLDQQIQTGDTTSGDGGQGDGDKLQSSAICRTARELRNIWNGWGQKLKDVRHLKDNTWMYRLRQWRRKGTSNIGNIILNKRKPPDGGYRVGSGGN